MKTVPLTLENIKTYKDKITPVGLLLIIFISFQIVSVFGLLISGGNLWTNIVWSGPSGATFPDFVETVFQSKGLRPYDVKAIYPPIVYVLFSAFSLFIPENMFASGNWYAASISPQVHTLAVVFFVASAFLLFAVIKRYYSTDGGYSKGLMWIIFTSAPLIYAVERGNILLLVMVPLVYFCANYDSGSTKKRLLSYLCLALVVSFKLYPVVLGLLILTDKNNKNKIKNAFICMLFGILVFLLPFLLTGGFSQIPKFIENIGALSGTHYSAESLGDRINISHTLAIIAKYFDVENIWLLTLLQNIASFGIVIAGVITTILHKAKWKQFAALMLVAILFPAFSIKYNALYLIIPLILFYNETHEKTALNYIYAVLFALCLAPLAFGPETFMTPVICKLNLGTIIPSVALLGFIALLFIDGVVLRIKEYKPKSLLNKAV